MFAFSFSVDLKSQCMSYGCQLLQFTLNIFYIFDGNGFGSVWFGLVPLLQIAKYPRQKFPKTWFNGLNESQCFFPL